MAHDTFRIKNLRDVRQKVDLTQQQLSGKAKGVSVKTISDIENDPDKNVRFRTVKRLKDALDGNANDLDVEEVR